MSYYSKYRLGDASPFATKLLNYAVIILVLSFVAGYLIHIYVGTGIWLISMLLGIVGLSLTSWLMFGGFFSLIIALGFQLYFKETPVNENIEGFNQDLGIGLIAFGAAYAILWFIARAIEINSVKK